MENAQRLGDCLPCKFQVELKEELSEHFKMKIERNSLITPCNGGAMNYHRDKLTTYRNEM